MTVDKRILFGVVGAITSFAVRHGDLRNHEPAAPREASSWRPVPCEIDSSRVVEDGPAFSSHPRYRVDVRYHYHVDGVTYRGRRHRLHSATWSDRADAVAAQSRLATTTTCYVDPGLASEATVEIGEEDDVLSRRNFVVLWLLVGVTSAAIVLRAARRDPLPQPTLPRAFLRRRR